MSTLTIEVKKRSLNWVDILLAQIERLTMEVNKIRSSCQHEFVLSRQNVKLSESRTKGVYHGDAAAFMFADYIRLPRECVKCSLEEWETRKDKQLAKIVEVCPVCMGKMVLEKVDVVDKYEEELFSSPLAFIFCCTTPGCNFRAYLIGERKDEYGEIGSEFQSPRRKR